MPSWLRRGWAGGICVICVICGQLWVGGWKFRIPNSEFRIFQSPPLHYSAALTALTPSSGSGRQRSPYRVGRVREPWCSGRRRCLKTEITAANATQVPPTTTGKTRSKHSWPYSWKVDTITTNTQKKALKKRMKRRLSLTTFDRYSLVLAIVTPDVYPLYVCRRVMIPDAGVKSIEFVSES